MAYCKICTENQLISEGRLVKTINDTEILLIYTQGKYFAVSNICPHAQTKLESGRIENGTLTCSNHGTCFDLKTGTIRIDLLDEDLLEMIDPENLPFGPLKIFPVKVEDENILIDM